MYLEYSNRSYFRRHWPPMRHTHTRWSMLIQFAADKFLHVDTSELHGYGCCTLLMQPARTTLNRSQRQMSWAHPACTAVVNHGRCMSESRDQSKQHHLPLSSPVIDHTANKTPFITVT